MEPTGHVVVVGAGVAGTGVVVQLVAALAARRDRTADRAVNAVTVVDPHPPGWGLAFGDPDPLLLCNSAADANSLLAGDPLDFVRHLRGLGRPVGPLDCVPRSWLAAYCRDHYDRARETAARHGVTVTHVPAGVRTVTTAPGDGTRRRVLLDDGRELTADAVVVCTGVREPKVPDGFAGLTGHPRYLDAPYPAARLRERLRPGSRVLVLGTRQSAVDAALLLCREGHRPTLTSRSGVLPAVRGSLCAPPRPFPPLDRLARLDPEDPLLAERVLRCVVEAVRLTGPLPLRRQSSRAAGPVERLREETALVEAGACTWQQVVAAGMEAVIELGARLPADRCRALMDRFDWAVSRYVTAMTVVNARRLLDHLDAGVLRLAPHYPAAVTADPDGWQIHWPGAAAPEPYDHVVAAAGFHLPLLHRSADGTALHVTGAPPGSAPVDRLEADLRVRPAAGGPPDPVWVVGVGTHVRIPFANHLRNVVRQARDVAVDVTEAMAGSVAVEGAGRS
ncbi:hypothetical protein GCM10010218_45880 [Streptomyces mashuensis]|uniref:FAD-dependent urate hydroxylase HpyO/Asp monooxygenase CreE-like FAD/NAD(P)-binding domain-containing protein n=1 Tax=Streptomyces mashuensis TaxID=33904 RepID=A0A919B797_9ACTN|nr:FAD/NAD(P)-binding protein [Streptomyces mashuensis]GHF59243.1 hypothetical protein GCM10010218_45880 [Streptomyces mashuensis]